MEGLFIPPRPKKWTKTRIAMVIVLILLILLLLAFIAVFVIVPLVFMGSVSFQRMLIFTRFGVPTEQDYFKHFHQPAFRNLYITVKDVDNTTNISIGLWHMLPTSITYDKLYVDNNIDYDEVLRNSTYDVMLYMHGTGESRGNSVRKYQIFRHNFHVIAFDYRGYGDSSKAVLSEDGIVNDCVQIYKWLMEQTNSSIFVWGHSMGTAYATKTISLLAQEDIAPKGLILESAFTSLRDVLPVSPFGKYFAWLPWFEQTILNPLQENGFIFDTASNIQNVTCPIMFLHAQDDTVVPIRFSEQLNEIASARSESFTKFHEFAAQYNYDHFFIYQDPFFQYFIMDFMNKCKNGTDME